MLFWKHYSFSHESKGGEALKEKLHKPCCTSCSDALFQPVLDGCNQQHGLPAVHELIHIWEVWRMKREKITLNHVKDERILDAFVLHHFENPYFFILHV